METGTLDFDDLMDTGDFPGFEIAKFTPANDEDGKSNEDDILRTPEHEQENDFVLKETQPLKLNDPVKENGECSNSEENSCEQQVENKADDVDLDFKVEKVEEEEDEEEDSSHVDDSNGHNVADKADLDENVDSHEPGSNQSTENAAGAETETGADNEPVVELDDNDDEGADIEEIVDDENGEGDDDANSAKTEEKEKEPSPKKKKMTLLAPRPKMKLWAGKQNSEENLKENQSDESTESTKKSPSKEDRAESPQQQSFLSFLNLQPGSSKPQDQDESKKEKTKTEDFYSRKRLRTRKKVSYAEDVIEGVDEDYKEEDEEEEPYDHQINVPKRRRSSGTSNKLKDPNSAIMSAMAKYAQAMQSKPAVNNMNNNFNNNKKILPKLPSQPSVHGYRNILASVTTNNDAQTAGNSNGQMKGLFECGLCGTFFNTAGQFISHQESVHGSETKAGRPGMETFRCEICQFVLTNRFAYLEHKRMKHNDKNNVTFNCNKCGSSFGYLIDLQKHKQVCGLPYTYTCTHCNLQLKDMQELMAHKAKYHPPSNANTATTAGRQWVCCAQKFCSFKCLTHMEMKHHVMNKHNQNLKQNELFPCNAPRCTRIFPTREKLTEHKRDAHASEFIVQYQCMECKACYSTKTLLAEHQYLHMMDKLKKCDLCMRRFSTFNQLTKHKEVHCKKKTYRCTACTRWCEDRQELATHECLQKKGRFGNSRIYFCDICHHDFKSDEEMFQHRQSHKNYFQCSTCRWEEHSEEEYFKHREFHGLLTCRECAEEIPTEKEMETHMKAHEFYVKMEEVEEEDGEPLNVMYLVPNLMNAIKV